MNELKSRFNKVTRDTDANGFGHLLFTGINLQVVGASGIPTVAINGLANRIVDYNEINSTFTTNKTNSLNLIVGSGANYSSYGSIVASLNNVSSNSYLIDWRSSKSCNRAIIQCQ